MSHSVDPTLWRSIEPSSRRTVDFYTMRKSICLRIDGSTRLLDKALCTWIRVERFSKPFHSLVVPNNCVTPLGLCWLRLSRRKAYLQDTISKDCPPRIAMRQYSRQQQLAFEIANADKEFIAPFGQLDFIQFDMG